MRPFTFPLFTLLMTFLTAAFALAGNEPDIVVIAPNHCSLGFIKGDIERTRQRSSQTPGYPSYTLDSFNTYDVDFKLKCPASSPRCLGNFFLAHNSFVSAATDASKTQLSVTVSGSFVRFYDAPYVPNEDHPENKITKFEVTGEHTKSFTLSKDHIRNAENKPQVTVHCPPDTCTIYRFDSNTRPPEFVDGSTTHTDTSTTLNVSLETHKESAIVTRKVNGRWVSEMVVNAQHIEVVFEKGLDEIKDLRKCTDERTSERSNHQNGKPNGYRRTNSADQ